MKNSFKYPNRTFRIVISFIASFYILFHGRSFDFKVFITPVFYVAFIVSFTVALLLVMWVHYVSKSLDKENKWFETPLKRLIKQSIFAVLIPLVIDFSLFAVYFYFLGSNIFENGFLKHDFPVIILLIVLLNVYYAAFSLYKMWRDMQKQNAIKFKSTYDMSFIYDSQEREVAESVTEIEEMVVSEIKPLVDILIEETKSDDIHVLTINNKSLNASFQVKEDIVYFYITNRKMHAVTIHGNEYPFKQTIAELEDKYGVLGFCRISRNVVINCDMVRGYTSGVKKGTYIVILKPPFRENLPKNSNQYFFITKEYFDNFKEQIEKI